MGNTELTPFAESAISNIRLSGDATSPATNGIFGLDQTVELPERSKPPLR
jgi:hypothetical protein